MRIVQGRFKGRNIKVSDKGVRPVSDRVKEACFSVLRDILPNAIVFDMFSGSGALAFESISAGAKSAVLTDNSKNSIDVIRKNIKTLGLETNTELYLFDAILFIEKLAAKKARFDIIFIDPPYSKGLVNKALQAIMRYDILAPFGYIVCFAYAKDEISADIQNVSLVYEKLYGQTRFLVYNNLK